LGKKEKEGVLFVLMTVFIAGALPIIIKYGIGFLNPLFFASSSSFVAGAFLFTLAVIQGNWKILFFKNYMPKLLLIGFFGITLSNLFFFYGTSLTSAINASILLVIEPVYSIFIGYLFLNEKITFKQNIYTFIIILGTITVLYKERLIFNYGDLMIMCTPLCWQIAHFFSKKLMSDHHEITPRLIATARTLFGGVFLVLLSYINGLNQFDAFKLPYVLWIVILQGIIGFAVQYSFWYEAIKRLNLSKATSIISIYPAFSILLAWIILKELPTFQQIGGFIVIVIGIFCLLSIKSEKRMIETI